MTGKTIALALIAVTTSTVLQANPIEYPPDNAEFFLQLSADYKTKTNPDGSLIGIGPKVVIALTSMRAIESAAAAKAALPEFSKKFFVETLMFQELQGQGVVNGKIAREGGDGLAVQVLTAMGKNSDGRSVAITATTFASEQGRYFVFFTAARPEDKEEAGKTSREILGTMTTATNEED
jgi:hypothetical protein